MPEQESTSGISRRTLCLGAGATVALLGLGAMKLVPAEACVRPPGAQDENRMLAECVRCERCVEACPRGVIRVAHFESGIAGIRTPIMDFHNDYCTACAEENDGVPLCELACPTEAISVAKGEDATKIIIGEAQLDTDQCLAYRLAGCRFCYDACPYEAIELDERKRPVVLVDKCNGCGACESVCVSLKEGSIVAGSKFRAIHVVTPGTRA